MRATVKLSVGLLALLTLAALGAAPAIADAKPTVGMPRTIVTTVGETKGLRLISNDLKHLHWFWLRKPKASIALALPTEMLPENDEAVNGLSGRTGVYVTGRSAGTTSAMLGYFTADKQRLLKTVLIRITVS